MSPFQATLLGIVEGVSEFLPISSTGHLILASSWLRLGGEAVKTFEVILQAGALGAVLGLYRSRAVSMWRGVQGRDAQGRKLLVNLTLSALPALFVGAALHHVIKAALFRTWPVVAALALGGVCMIVVDRWLRRRTLLRQREAMASQRRASQPARSIESITLRDAVLIGCMQCAALWPGVSRAMVTLVAGLWLGLPSAAAAEYSFLLAMPTLGAATLFDAMQGGAAVILTIGLQSLVCGFVAAAVVAALSIRVLLRSLARWGLAPFGWYRIGLAAVVGMTALHY